MPYGSAVHRIPVTASSAFHRINDETITTIPPASAPISAGRLRQGHCAHAHVARLGGDEFVLLVTRPRDCARLEAFVEAVLGDMRQTIQRGGTAVPTSATIGAARFGPDVQDAADLLRQADLALYDAKRRQRGTATVHDVPGSISVAPTSLKLVRR